MKGRVFMSKNKRMTWAEIEKNYPAQWVRIENAEFDKDHPTTIIAGIVTKHGDEITSQDRIDVADGLCYTEFVEYGSSPQLGGICL